MTVEVLVWGAPLFLMEVWGSALLSGHQWSSLPAGQGSHRSDFHLREVEGQQVALPRFPVHALGDGQRHEQQRDLYIKDKRKREKQITEGSDEREGQGENREVCHRRLFWHDRQAEWQTLINSSLWLHFTWEQTCFYCYCFLPTNIGGDICSHSIMDEI